MTPGSAGRRRSGWLLCALSVLASAASVAFPVYALDLRDAGPPGTGPPDGITALAFPLALLLFLILEVPVVAAVVALWKAYLSVRRRGHGG